MQIFVYDFHHSIATRTPSRKVNSEKLKVDAFQQAVHACFMFQLWRVYSGFRYPFHFGHDTGVNFGHFGNN